MLAMGVLLSFAERNVMAQVVAADYFVATNGADSYSGAEVAPFATVGRARDAVRARIAAGLTGDITVLIRGGEYELAETLVFGPDDSGTAQHSVTYAAYPGETVILSGGQKVTGWKQGAGELWTAEVTEVTAGNWYPRQMIVNDTRRPRARSPNQGYYYGMASADGTSFTFPGGQLGTWARPDKVEIVALVEWMSSRTPIHGIDVPANKLMFPSVAPPEPPLVNPFSLGHIIGNMANWPYYFENAFEMLDTPGEWYLNSESGALFYWPMPGETLDTLQAIVPRLQTLIKVEGTPERPVSNIHFDHLNLAHTQWVIPPQGFRPEKAGGFERTTNGVVQVDDMPHTGYEALPAAVQFAQALRCSVTRCRLSHTSGGGILLGVGCAGNSVQGNAITDIGGTGIQVGGFDPFPVVPQNIPKDNDISNNLISRCAQEHLGCVGVFAGITDHTVVSHNLIRNLPYTGIDMGFWWDRSVTGCKSNVVEYNHIHHVVQRLADGGGIHTLGYQPGSIIRGNLVHDILHYSGVADTHGIFFDNGSKGFRVEGNAIYATSDAPFRYNDSYAEDLSWGANDLTAHAATPLAVDDAVGEWACLLQSASQAGLEAPYWKDLLGQERPEITLIANSAATGVTATGATLNGSLIFTGGVPTTVFVYWGKTDPGTNKGLWDKVVQFSGAATIGTYSTNVSFKSSCAATYFYRYVASNANAEVWSEPVSLFIAGPAGSSKTPPVAGYGWWLDASDLDSMALSGSSVTTWMDKSGSGINLDQASAANQPALVTQVFSNGLPAVYFAGSNWLENALAQPFTGAIHTVFAVLQLTKPGAEQELLDTFPFGVNRRLIFLDLSGVSIYRGAGGGWVANGNYSSSPLAVFSSIWNGGSSAVWIDGSNQVASSMSTDTSIGASVSLGAQESRGSGFPPQNFYEGYIGEVLVYNSALSPTDRAKVEAYLHTKWFLPPSAFNTGTQILVR